VATWKHVSRLALALPQAEEGTTWPILGAKVEHLIAKEAFLADESGVFFTTPHFDGHPSVLIRLPDIGLELLEEVVTEAWLACAPDRLVRDFLAERGDP
jgi:hypothetical protein